jgi:nicotinamidase-related amidase
MGVESTARQAHESGYEIVIAEDACTGLGTEMHGFAFNAIFPMIARVRNVGDIQLRKD